MLRDIVERRLEDRIRRLCARLIRTDDGNEFHTVATELRASLAEHIDRLRSKLLEYPLGIERRTSK